MNRIRDRFLPWSPLHSENCRIAIAINSVEEFQQFLEQAITGEIS